MVSPVDLEHEGLYAVAGPVDRRRRVSRGVGVVVSDERAGELIAEPELLNPVPLRGIVVPSGLSLVACGAVLRGGFCAWGTWQTVSTFAEVMKPAGPVIGSPQLGQSWPPVMPRRASLGGPWRS